MKNYYFNDEAFESTSSYSTFISANSGKGYLTIRAYAASKALPIKDVKIIVSKVIDDNKVIFFEGTTDESGLVRNIMLPAPLQNKNDLEVPLKTSYDIEATFEPDYLDKKYNINMYDGINVLQNIIVVPKTFPNVGGLFGN